MGVVAEFSPPKPPAVLRGSSSLLENTPPAVIRALSTAFPLLAAADRVLGVLTWTSRDRFESVLLAASWVLAVQYFELLLMYFLPLCAAAGVVLLSGRDGGIPPSLETVAATAERAGERFRLFVAPVAALRLSSTDVLRLLFATMFMSPVYVVAAYFFVTPRDALFYGGLIFLTWHSLWFKVLRSVAWRFKTVRLLVFLATGIDRAPRPAPRKDVVTSDAGVSCTYVIYENQRRWLGVGWTANTVPEERAPWTDPSLNETRPIDMFELPASDTEGLRWEWIDEHWLLDASNGGTLGPEGPQRLSAHPDDDEGYVYFDNQWASPSATASFSRPTRRRRWVRVARLVHVASTAAPEALDKATELRHRLAEPKPVNTEVLGPPI